MKNLKLCLKSPERQKLSFKVGEKTIGKDFVIIAGPCSVENEKQMIESAVAVKEAGADILRGGAFKPRTSPYSFQGLGLNGLKLLRKASQETGLPVITEVIDPRDVPWVSEYADIIQIGARNMQNFSLLQEAGRSHRAVMLKRGMYSTISEWFNCAEYILAEGNDKLMLCERGIRSFETLTRNTLDLSSVPLTRQMTCLPIFVDPSHGTGRRELIEPMSFGAAAVGADGLIIESHVCPDKALCDGAQSLTPQEFKSLMQKLTKLSRFIKDSALYS